ncbi:protein of unknown function [Cyanobium sp. NIES-981]|nr:protein of unknown function [Cyanobium sp. NIES-981]
MFKYFDYMSPDKIPIFAQIKAIFSLLLGSSQGHHTKSPSPHELARHNHTNELTAMNPMAPQSARDKPVPLSQLQTTAPISQPTPPMATSKQKSLADYCKGIAEQTGLTETQVRLVCELFLSGLLKQLRAGIPFVSWMIHINPEPESTTTTKPETPRRTASLLARITQVPTFNEDKFQQSIQTRLNS